MRRGSFAWLVTTPNTLLFRFVLPEPKIVRFKMLNASPLKIDTHIFSDMETLREANALVLVPEIANLGIVLGGVPEHGRRLDRELGSGLQESIDGRIEFVSFDRSAPVIIAVDDRSILSVEQSR